MTEKHFTDQLFTDLQLEPALLDGLKIAGLEKCTPIQAEALPAALAGKDVAGQAQTGTGKTATFLLATMNALLQRDPAENRKPTQPRAIILAPTRELAIQIHKDAQILGQCTGFKLGLVYGGTGYDEQRKILEQGVDILTGTPGRLIDYFKQGLFDLKAVQVVVLDEADRMFDLGFIKDIRFLLRRMPPQDKRINLLFSATMSYRVNELAYEHMNGPQVIKIESDKVIVEKVSESIYYPANEEKIPLLLNLLEKHGSERTLVFVNTKHAAENVCNWLTANNHKAGVLSGDVPQRKREQLLEKFRSSDIAILVATDVAARGLHIDAVSHVFNYDLPQDAEDYVHRIGRTARAGASGDAISFACEKYAYSIMEIEEYIGHSLPMRKIDADLFPQIKTPSAGSQRRNQKDKRNERRPSPNNKRKESRASPTTDKKFAPKRNTPTPTTSDETTAGIKLKRNTHPEQNITTPPSALKSETANGRSWDRFGQEIPALG